MLLINIIAVALKFLAAVLFCVAIYLLFLEVKAIRANGWRLPEDE